MTFFGKPVYDLVSTARKSYPSSLAAQDIVWSYQAPKKTGGGSIDIKLYSDQEHWSRGVLLKGNGNLPDAMVACDAGLFAYPEWSDPMIFAAASVFSDLVRHNRIVLLTLAEQVRYSIRDNRICRAVHEDLHQKPSYHVHGGGEEHARTRVRLQSQGANGEGPSHHVQPLSSSWTEVDPCCQNAECVQRFRAAGGRKR